MLSPLPPLFTADEHDQFATRVVFLASIFAILAIYFIGGDAP
jgi:hypothetical protein